MLLATARQKMASSLCRPLVATCLVVGLVTRWASPTAASDFAALYKKVRPSVVYVVVARSDGAVSGSGFVYQSNPKSSLIVTANHVVEGAQKIDVILNSDLHQRYPATVVTRDHVKDVALLKINIGTLKPLSLAKSPEEGSTVAVIGYPRVARFFERVEGDDLRPSVHEGIISAIRLNGEIVQYDAISDHGDSGGPVIDTNTGEVVAIVHGAILDPDYAARGLEQPLPGSEYGMSASTIRSVVEGKTGSTTTTASASKPATNGTSSGESSASYRVGVGLPQYSDPTAEAISQAVLQRLVTYYTGQASFYVVQTQFGMTSQNAQVISGNCQDERLTALMEPLVRWNFKGQYVPGVYDSRVAEVWVDLLVTDCSGAPFYFGEKTKWERSEFSHRDPQTEVIDMSNDMLDQVIKDFATYSTAHQDAWNSLLKTGLALDPKDGHYHALFYPYPDKDGVWHVWTVFPGGPADVAGVKAGDVIESVNGTPLDGKKYEDVAPLFDAESYEIDVRRPGGDASITVRPKKYNDLLKMIQD